MMMLRTNVESAQHGPLNGHTQNPREKNKNNRSRVVRQNFRKNNAATQHAVAVAPCSRMMMAVIVIPRSTRTPEP